MESSHKPDKVRDFDKMPRSEDQIRDDLREQLEAMHLRYLRKWVWPCQ
jgi:hypothetical protein